MFIDEATIAAKLHHANIVQIFDFDMIEGSYYIAMEYIEGKDVKHIIVYGIEINKPLNIFQSVHIVIEVCKGLHYAHTKKHKGKPLNIIHRDISPHNLMVSFNGEVKLMDFGIAKAASRSTKTRAGTVKGKCAYMSPEQARGKESRSPLRPVRHWNRVVGDGDLPSFVPWRLGFRDALECAQSRGSAAEQIQSTDSRRPGTDHLQVAGQRSRRTLQERRRLPEGAEPVLLQSCRGYRLDFAIAISCEELFTEDIRALAEMVASERTGFMDVVREDIKKERESSQPRPQRIVRSSSRPQLKPVQQPSPQPVNPQPVVTADQMAAGGIEADATLPMSGVEEYMQKMGIPPPGQEEPQRTVAISPEQIKSAGTPQQQQNYPSQPQLQPVNQPGPYQQNQAYPPQQMMSQHNMPQQQGYHPQYTPAPVQTAHAEDGGRGRSLVLFFIIFAIICGLAGTAAYIYFGGHRRRHRRD